MSTAAKKAEAAAAAGATSAADGEPGDGKKKKKKLLLVGVVVLLVAAAAVWFFLFRGAGEAAAEPEPVPGEVVALEPISINLSDGHYLRIGIALQVIEGPAHAPDGSRALDLTISTFSGRTTAELSDPATRDAIKAELVAHVDEAYHHDVMDVYFTEFVTQ